MGEVLLFFLVMFLLVMIGLAIICIPIMIANERGIEGSQKTLIIVLSWLGIFFGVTWFVALFLSLLWRGEEYCCADNLDKLEKLSRLYKEKAITKEEYEKLKSKLLN